MMDFHFHLMIDFMMVKMRNKIHPIFLQKRMIQKETKRITQTKINKLLEEKKKFQNKNFMIMEVHRENSK